MKRILLSLVAMLFILSTLASCNHSGQNASNNENKNKVEKFKGDIISGTVFSEGLALISNDEKSYCINTNGEIVFETEKTYIDSFGGTGSKGFKNGLLLIDGGFYDIKGTYTLPEDVGATKFYDCILEAGFIFADVGEEDSSIIKRGVLDTNFKWVVEPSEKYYQNCDKVSINLDNNYGYFEKGYYFNHSGDGGFNGAVEVLTGKTYKSGEFPNNDFSSSTWLGTAENTVVDFNGNVKIDLTDKNEDINFKWEFDN